MQCEDVSGLLAEAAEGRVLLEPKARHHVEQCLRCQAELVQYRKLLRDLHSLRREVIEPAPGLLPDIFAAIEAAGERRALRELLDGRKVAYLSGLAAATAAGVGGALVIASRSRRKFHLAS